MLNKISSRRNHPYTKGLQVEDTCTDSSISNEIDPTKPKVKTVQPIIPKKSQEDSAPRICSSVQMTKKTRKGIILKKEELIFLC